MSREHLDLLARPQVPEPDGQVVGGGHQQPAGQRVEPDGVDLLRVACEWTGQLSITCWDSPRTGEVGGTLGLVMRGTELKGMRGL